MVSSVFLSPQGLPAFLSAAFRRSHTEQDNAILRRGDVLVETRSHGLSGGSVTAKIFIPASPTDLWPKLTHYSRWTEYFPNISHSEVVASDKICRRLYQVGQKAFLALSAQVEIYLKVYERTQRSIQFRLERGTFKDFGADLTLQDWRDGTLLTYTVQATPIIPVPGFLIEQGMRQDLPANLKNMRRILCG